MHPMEGRPTDGDLFTRAQRGDSGAYEEIVRRYQEVAFRTAYVVTGSAADAEDAAQEGFVKAYRALATFGTGAEPRPWLLRVVANEARIRARAAGGPPEGRERMAGHAGHGSARYGTVGRARHCHPAPLVPEPLGGRGGRVGAGAGGARCVHALAGRDRELAQPPHDHHAGQP